MPDFVLPLMRLKVFHQNLAGLTVSHEMHLLYIFLFYPYLECLHLLEIWRTKKVLTIKSNFVHDMAYEVFHQCLSTQFLTKYISCVSFYPCQLCNAILLKFAFAFMSFIGASSISSESGITVSNERHNCFSSLNVTQYATEMSSNRSRRSGIVTIKGIFSLVGQLQRYKEFIAVQA